MVGNKAVGTTGKKMLENDRYYFHQDEEKNTMG
jgi:hypothetical protein